MVLFDKTSIGIFVCGGAFTFLVSYTILTSIEHSTDKLLEATYEDIVSKDNEPDDIVINHVQLSHDPHSA